MRKEIDIVLSLIFIKSIIKSEIFPLIPKLNLIMVAIC